MFCPPMPSHPRLIRPSRMSRGTTYCAVLMGVAKHRPCAPRMMAVLTPMTSPRAVTRGPPELPGFSAASVWITLSMSRPDCERSDRPDGAHHACRHRALESEGVADRDHQLADTEGARISELCRRKARFMDAHHGEVGIGVVADKDGGVSASVGEDRLHPRCAVNDVAVGEDESVGGENEPRAAAVVLSTAAVDADLDVHDGRAGFIHAFHNSLRVSIQEGDVSSMYSAHDKKR